jgi:hypothetical protein
MVLTPAAGLPSGRAPQPWATTRAGKPDTGARWWFTVEGPGHPPGGPARRTRPGAPPGSRSWPQAAVRYPAKRSRWSTTRAVTCSGRTAGAD